MRGGNAWPKSYELLGVVGTGATSVVHRARCRDNQAECAVKVFDLRNLPDSTEERIQKEVSTLALLDHPNVVRLYASFVARDAELWMVMQLFTHGSVLDVMRDKFPTGLSEDAAGALLLPVLNALQYLHAQSALHRDIKAGNVFVSSSGQVVLGDFGVATELIESGEAATASHTDGPCGHHCSLTCRAGTPHVCRHPVLDGARSADAANVVLCGCGRVELRHHRHRAGQGPRAALGPQPHEGRHEDHELVSARACECCLLH